MRPDRRPASDGRPRRRRPRRTTRLRARHPGRACFAVIGVVPRSGRRPARALVRCTSTSRGRDDEALAPRRAAAGRRPSAAYLGGRLPSGTARCSAVSSPAIGGSPASTPARQLVRPSRPAAGRPSAPCRPGWRRATPAPGRRRRCGQPLRRRRPASACALGCGPSPCGSRRGSVACTAWIASWRERRPGSSASGSIGDRAEPWPRRAGRPAGSPSWASRRRRGSGAGSAPRRAGRMRQCTSDAVGRRRGPAAPCTAGR